MQPRDFTRITPDNAQRKEEESGENHVQSRGLTNLGQCVEAKRKYKKINNVREHRGEAVRLFNKCFILKDLCGLCG